MSLKDALLKAGLKATKSENERARKPKKEQLGSEKHQYSRNFCEACNTTQPDVEKFDHRNRLIDAKWICSNCADKLEIVDDYRVTHQSQFAKQGKFRRQYGPTKKFPKNNVVKASGKNSTKSKTSPKKEENFNR